mgnify:CR=1 FL=1
MAKSKFESLIEHILNDDTTAARDIFHDIVVEKSREIYNNIVAEDEEKEVEESTLEEFGMEDQSDDMQGDIEADQSGLGTEGGDEFGDEGGDEFGGDEGGEEEIEDRVVDLEAALDELKAEFDKLMGDEEGEDFGGDEMGGDDMGGDEFGGDEGGEEFPSVPEGMVREYVEKAPAPVKSENGAYTKSPVAGSNNMGGSSSNIARGGSEGNPTGPAKPNNAYSKGQTDMGAVDPRDAGKKAFSGKAPAPKTGESSVNAKSPLAK